LRYAKSKKIVYFGKNRRMENRKSVSDGVKTVYLNAYRRNIGKV
jgi:hypothetical protein